MKIDTRTAQQFLNALSDRIGGGDMEIAAITPEEAGGMNRKEMDKFLIELMGFVVDSYWKD
jgi:hypothetical protein